LGRTYKDVFEGDVTRFPGTQEPEASVHYLRSKNNKGEWQIGHQKFSSKEAAHSWIKGHAAKHGPDSVKDIHVIPAGEAERWNKAVDRREAMKKASQQPMINTHKNWNGR
jgi:hypothetical protein